MLNRPGKWEQVIDVARRTNLTKRQVASAVSKLPSPPFDNVREPGYGQFYIRFNGTLEEALVYKRGFYKACYQIDDDMIDMVVAVLTTVGWMTVADIACEIPMSKITISRVLKVIDDMVDSESRGPTTYYKRKVL